MKSEMKSYSHVSQKVMGLSSENRLIDLATLISFVLYVFTQYLSVKSY